MNIKQYPQEKREIISKLPFDQLMKFCKEVSPQLLETFMRKLPVIQGFRTGTNKGLSMRLNRYLRRIEHWNGSDWSLFNDLWLDWTKTHMKLDETLSQFDNSEDFQIDPLGTPPNSALDIECFEYLRLKSEEAQIPRELIKQFYHFGYFLVDPLIERNIALSKSAAELELFELPNKIKQIEETIKAFETILLGTQRRIERQEEKDKIETRLNTRVDALEIRLREIQTHFIKLAEITSICDDKISQIQNDLVTFDTHYSELEGRLSKDLQESYESKYLRFKNDLHEQIEILQELFSGELKILSEKVNSVESSIMEGKKVEVIDKEPYSNLRNPWERYAPIKVEHLYDNDQFHKLDTADEFTSALLNNLRNIGMQSVTAQVLTKEICAALAGGQLITFVGSVASIIAMVCARCLSGPNVSRIRIPIGLIDSTEFDNIFLKVIETSEEKNSLCALIIEGMNLSAPEAYAASLRQLITERFFGINPRGKNLILFGTLVDGPSALDVPQELCEWGPVFHTDCLEWRDKWSQRVMRPGSITSGVWENWLDNLSEPPEDWEEILSDFSSLGGQSTVLWRRMLYLAAVALNREDTVSQLLSLTQSLIFGWLLPHSLATGMDLTNFDKVLLEWQVDAPKSDDRLKKFLWLTTRTLRER